MNTKQRILDAALTLFSERGYSAVRVSDIADAVGIKAPSLYKHFKGKQQIFDLCIEAFTARMEQARSELHLPGTPQAGVDYTTASTEEIVRIADGLFLFYLQDDVAAKFRRMLTMERYRNPRLDELFDTYFAGGAVTYEESVFSELMQAKVIRAGNPHLIAMRFYAPIFYLLQKYDTRPDQIAEARQELEGMVREFCDTYQLQGVRDDHAAD